MRSLFEGPMHKGWVASKQCLNSSMVVVNRIGSFASQRRIEMQPSLCALSWYGASELPSQLGF